jgi:hypothetical protein
MDSLIPCIIHMKACSASNSSAMPDSLPVANLTSLQLSENAVSNEIAGVERRKTDRSAFSLRRVPRRKQRDCNPWMSE